MNSQQGCLRTQLAPSIALTVQQDHSMLGFIKRVLIEMFLACSALCYNSSFSSVTLEGSFTFKICPFLEESFVVPYLTCSVEINFT